MQLPATIHQSPHPSPATQQLPPGAGGAYHGPPPNVMVSASGMPHPVNMQQQAQQHPQQHPQQHHPHMHPPVHPHMMPPDHPGMRGPPVGMGPPMPYPMHMYNLLVESRIHEMNKRLHMWAGQTNLPEDHHSQWWQAFASEFFDDDARMTFILPSEDGHGPKQYSIGRTLIPRFFRSIFESGVKAMHYHMTNTYVEPGSAGFAVLKCENLVVVTKHDKPLPMEVQTEGSLICEFIGYEEPLMWGAKIRHWRLELKHHQEFLPRHVASDPNNRELISDDVTGQGMTDLTLNYLRMFVILEPMQKLMSIYKECDNLSKQKNDPNQRLSPRKCLERTLFENYRQQHSRMSQQVPHHPMSGMPGQMPGGQAPLPPHVIPQAIEEPAAKPKRKRTRKGSQGGGGSKKGKNAAAAAANASPITPNVTSFAPLAASNVDVMIVSEPSMMGGEYGEEDERMITRLENVQFNPNVPGGGMPPGHPHHGPPPGGPQFLDMGPGPPPGWQPPPGGLPPGMISSRPGSTGTPHTPGSRIGTPMGGMPPGMMVTGQPGSAGGGPQHHQRTNSSGTPDHIPSQSANGNN